jgi:hypothetical protein
MIIPPVEQGELEPSSGIIAARPLDHPGVRASSTSSLTLGTTEFMNYRPLHAERIHMLPNDLILTDL